jgi:hypothetical protein
MKNKQTVYLSKITGQLVVTSTIQPIIGYDVAVQYSDTLAFHLKKAGYKQFFVKAKNMINLGEL